MASGVFGLKKIYKRQVENVINNNFNSWTENYERGYIMGGENPGGGTNNSVEKYSYSDGSSISIPEKLPASSGQKDAMSVMNSNYGYHCGGNNPAPSCVVSRFDFSTEQFSLPGNNLPTILDYGASISRTDYGYGYIIGGQNPTIPNPRAISTITRLDFSTETISPTTNHPQSFLGIRAFNGTTYGYTVGGGSLPNTSSTTVYRMDFSNDTISTPGKNLLYGRFGACVNESSIYGYITSGQGTSSIERLEFSSETVYAISTLPVGSAQGGSFFSSLNEGYTLAINSTSLNRLNFDTETIDTFIPYANPRSKSTAISSRKIIYNKNTGTFSYSTRGTSSNALDKLSFQTETWTTLPNSLNSKQGSAGASSTNNYGYIFGGNKSPGSTSLISRIDFSNDLVQEASKRGGNSIDTLVTLPSTASLESMGVTQTNSYTYLLGGNNPGTSYIWRMDFSNEDISLRSALLPGNIEELKSAKNTTDSYFTRGTNTNSTILRLNFSTETLSSSSNSYPISLISSIKCSSTSPNFLYGYFFGGDNPAATPTRVSSIYRMDLSNQTFALSSNSFQNSDNKVGSSSYNDLYSYIYAAQSGDSTVYRMDFATEIYTQQTPAPASKANSSALTNANV